MQLKRVAEAKLPTPWGDFLMVGFEELAAGQDHVALVYGDISGQAPVLARVHSRMSDGRCPFLVCVVIAVFSWKRRCRTSLKRARDPALSPSGRPKYRFC